MRNKIFSRIANTIVLLCAIFIQPVSAAPQGKPDFKDEAALREYVKNATLEERIKLYSDYLVSRPLNSTANRVLGAGFTADLGATTPERRKVLSDLVIRTAKTKGLPESSLYDFQEFLKAIALYPDVAASYYLALPIEARSYSFDSISLQGPRSTVLLSLLPTLLPKLSAWTRSQIFSESLNWFEQVGIDNDTGAMRNISLLLAERPSSLFAAVEPSYSVIRKPTALSFVKTPLTEKELEYFLPLFFQFEKGDKLEKQTTVINSWYGEAKKDTETLNLLAAARASGNPRVAALSRYLLLLENNFPLADAANWPPMGTVPSTQDDWIAFMQYRVAATRGEKLSDNDFLACLDPKRPSLAAAVLEDRFKPDYDDPSSWYVSASKAPKATPFQEAVLKKCLPLTGADSDQVLIPVLRTIILLSQSKHLTSITFLVRSPSFYMRTLAMQTLLRFADTTFFNLFMERLNDPVAAIRVLAINGLGKIRDSRAVDALARIVDDKDESMYIRVEAAQALGEIGDRRMIRIFTNILLIPADTGGRDSSLRMYAAQALGEQKERTAVNALLKNIDTEQETDLNYYCLEALGKISDTEGFRKLVPLFGKAWKAWLGKPESYRDNYYAALWALFLYKSADTEKICAEVFEQRSASYSEAAYMSAFYLTRQDKAAPSALMDYCGLHHAQFFSDEYRVYQFAVMLDKKWDPRSVFLIVDGIENYSDNVKSWTLSAMYEQPSTAFIPKLKAVYDSADASVRRWTATVADRVSMLIPVQPASPDLTATAPSPGAELVALADLWLTTEKDFETKRYLTGIATRLAAYRERTVP